MTKLKQENIELFSIKIGPQEIQMDLVSPIEKLFFELVANYVNTKFYEIKQREVDTIRSFACTLLDVAKDKFEMEKNIEKKIDSLELKISSLIEELDNQLIKKEN